MPIRKIIVLVTAALALAILASFFFVSPKKEQERQIAAPILGAEQAAIEVMLFEDFRCYGCRMFSEKVLPLIELHYLSTGKIRLKIIPLGFLDGSKILANAALEVYQLAPDKFLPFAKQLFHAAPNQEAMIHLAKEVGGIDMNRFKTCVNQNCHYDEVDRYLQAAKTLMGNHFRIPAFFINGVRLNTTDFKTIQEEIEKL